ncbi:hypothetical protein [Paenibacillus sp. CF384]|uniref:hypothetical protein n=1 Tax=Paenibacillus sp. CF384 TaxID=1884382 RepID=UPI000897583E|nr:hypothetical protein [Paenibacillus sp. CF384]SDX55548.1 hypothetical protein SAMN05518855_101665 [Paenibacillus sp. CF384]
MKKKFITAAMTLGVATVLVAGNSVISANASTFDHAQQVEVTGKHQPPAITKVEHVPVHEKIAVVTAEKAIQDKYNVSLSGMDISYNLGKREDMEGTFYFVAFQSQKYTYTDEELAKAKRDLLAGKEMDIQLNDLYVATINAETGEVVQVEKNPSASGSEFATE